MMTKFVRIPDSSFTFHYEINGPDELVKSERNTHTSVGLKARRLRNGEYGENNERR